MLLQYVKHILGVCHLEIGQILVSIRKEDDCLRISWDTFKRMRRKADGIGTLSVYEIARKDGGRDCNRYVFHFFQTLSNPVWLLASPVMTHVQAV